MSESFVNQITLDCLLNKQTFNKCVKSHKTKSINKQERKFYRKRTFALFKEIITGNQPSNLAPEVLYAYDNFINSCIHYFKAIDNNDLNQEEYQELELQFDSLNLNLKDSNEDLNFSKSEEADKFLMRSIKIDPPTLDKYVKIKSTKKSESIILPQQKNINLLNPELKTKGLKKKNINIKYEDNKKSEEI
jgi:hypothetical protein